MGIFNKVTDGFKKFINITDEDGSGYDDEGYNDEPQEVEADSSYYPIETPPAPQPKKARAERSGKVVNMDPGRAALADPSGKSQVIVRRVSSFSEVGQVADILKQKRIVVLNLEDCTRDVQRVIDILYGVAYANDGSFKRIADKAYMITPYNVPITGETYEEMGSDVEDDTY